MSEEEDYPEVERIYINTPKELATEFDNFDKLLVDTSISFFLAQTLTENRQRLEASA